MSGSADGCLNISATRRVSRVNVAIRQLAQSQVMGQGGGQEQPRISHQSLIIKGNVDAVGLVAW